MLKRLLALSLTVLSLFLLCSCLFEAEPVEETTTEALTSTEPATESTTELTEESTTEEDAIAQPAQPAYKPSGNQTVRTTRAQAAACEHNWQPANCRAPRTCSKCGATEGYLDPNGHNWVGNVCSICKKVKTTYTTAKAQTTAATTATTAAPTTEPTTVSTTAPTTVPTTAPVTEPTTAPTTVSTTAEVEINFAEFQ